MIEPANLAHDEYDDHLVILMMLMTMMTLMLLMMMALMMLRMAFCLRTHSHQEERHDTPSSFHLYVSPMTPNITHSAS